MKYPGIVTHADIALSPSIRREWIEIWLVEHGLWIFERSPSIRREWIEILDCYWVCEVYSGLPPYGGSGLKYFVNKIMAKRNRSPSIRREWIEIPLQKMQKYAIMVSLHTEGVD